MKTLPYTGRDLVKNDAGLTAVLPAMLPGMRAPGSAGRFLENLAAASWSQKTLLPEETHAMTDYTTDPTKTKLEYLESPVTAPKSPPAPEPTAAAQAEYTEKNARIEAIRRRPESGS